VASLWRALGQADARRLASMPSLLGNLQARTQTPPDSRVLSWLCSRGVWEEREPGRDGERNQKKEPGRDGKSNGMPRSTQSQPDRQSCQQHASGTRGSVVSRSASISTAARCALCCPAVSCSALSLSFPNWCFCPKLIYAAPSTYAARSTQHAAMTSNGLQAGGEGRRMAGDWHCSGPGELPDLTSPPRGKKLGRTDESMIHFWPDRSASSRTLPFPVVGPPKQPLAQTSIGLPRDIRCALRRLVSGMTVFFFYFGRPVSSICSIPDYLGP
jgi:hypothetical protein